MFDNEDRIDGLSQNDIDEGAKNSEAAYGGMNRGGEDYGFEAPRHGYSDAGYVAADRASPVPVSYNCEPEVKKERKKKRERRGMGAAGVVALCLVCVVLGGTFGWGVPYLMEQRHISPSEDAMVSGASSGQTPGGDSDSAVKPPQPTAGQLKLTSGGNGEEKSATEIYYSLATNQAVGITTEITYTNVFGYTTSSAVSGSGFVISEDGYIMTNYHVISDAVSGGYEVTVLFYDGSKYTAEIVGYEADNDVAVLKIDASGLNPVTIGDSNNILVGETVYAVGNALGELEYTMTPGMVSALDREITSYNSTTQIYQSINMFQISAAINKGNSGGPVYNSRGEVIGMATAKYSDTGVEGLGFAIPINDAVRIAQDLVTSGYVRGKAYLGIGAVTVSASVAQYYNMVEGAYVASVSAGSCADKAGVKVNDIIVAMDGTEIRSRDDLAKAKRNYSAGDSAVLKVCRSGEYIELTVVLDEETPENAAEEKQQETEYQQSQQQQQQQSGYGSYEDFFRQFFGRNPFG